MKKSKQAIAVLLIVIGFGSLAVSLSYIRPTLVEEGERLQSENETLKIQLNQVRELEANVDSYTSETAVYESQTNAILAEFPAEVREEDAILYADEIEDMSDYTISVVGINPGDLIYATGTSAAEETTDGTTDTTAETTETAASATASASLGILDEASVTVPTYQLFSMSASYDFTAGYEDMKEIIAKIYADPDKRNISALSLSYDSETGELIGNMSLNLYYLTGTDKTYTEPDAGKIKKGKDNIFETITKSKASKK
jgi:hypothetical protein